MQVSNNIVTFVLSNLKQEIMKTMKTSLVKIVSYMKIVHESDLDVDAIDYKVNIRPSNVDLELIDSYTDEGSVANVLVTKDMEE